MIEWKKKDTEQITEQNGNEEKKKRKISTNSRTETFPPPGGNMVCIFFLLPTLGELGISQHRTADWIFPPALSK